MTSFDDTPASRRSLEGWIIDQAIRLLILGLVAYWALKLAAPAPTRSPVFTRPTSYPKQRHR